MRPLAGETLWANCSPEAQPIQSREPSPGTGADPSPDLRIGTRPVTNNPIVLASATSRFCTGDVMRAAARPACWTESAWFNASKPAAAESSGCRLPIATARIGPSG